jgi:type VII secretion protein EccB
VPSRQDQLHSYQYSLQRVVAALVTHDPDPHRSPLRRAGLTALVSLVIAALAVGGVAIYGVLTGASSGTPTDESAVYVEKGSGARFIYNKTEGKLHPVLNYSSALLIANGQAPNVISTSHEQLAKVPLGDPLGIPDAPDSLPDPHDLLTAPWSVCTQAPQGSGSSAEPTSTLLVGDTLTDGSVASAAGTALLVRDPAGRTFLAYGNRRFLIPATRYQKTLSSLGWNDQQPWPVAAAWLNAVPLGPDLKPPAIPGSGDSSTVANYRVGQLVNDGRSADSTPTQWAVMLADGKAAVTEMQAKLLLAVPGAPLPVATGVGFTQLPDSSRSIIDAGDANALPSSVPKLAGTPQRACMTLPVGKNGDGIRIDPTVPAGTAVAGVTVPGGVQADLVHVPRGKGAVIVSATSPSAPAATGTVTIVTDTGRRYAVAGRDAVAKLGYGGLDLKQVPAELVALLPQGPALDPARARQSLPSGE